jgi:uncharacterized protein
MLRASLRVLTVFALLLTVPGWGWWDSNTIQSKMRASRYKIPKPDHNYVNDFARMLSPTDAGNLKVRLERLERETQVEMTVVTVTNLAYYRASDADSLALDFFNTWGVGNRPQNDGVLLLIARDDRKIVFKAGDGWHRASNDEFQSVIQNHIGPAFRSGKFSAGIMAGMDVVMAFGRRSNAYRPEAPPTTHPSSNSSSKNLPFDTSPLSILIVLLVLGIMVLSVLAAAYAGYRQAGVLGCILGFFAGLAALMIADSARRRRNSYRGSGGSWGSSGSSSSGSFGGGSSSGSRGSSGGW